MKSDYLPISEAYERAFGYAPARNTLLRKRAAGLKAVFVGNRWLTTIENVRSFEELAAEQRSRRQVSTQLTPAAASKAMKTDEAFLDQLGI